MVGQNQLFQTGQGRSCRLECNQDFRALLDEAFGRTGKPVRLIGAGVRFAETTPENAQLDLL